MDEHPDSALHYGHVGRAVYLPEEQTWTFTRSFAKFPPIVYAGVTKTTVPSPFRTDDAQPVPRVPEKTPRKLITSVHPDLAASWSSIREEPLSKTVTTTTEQYDPEVSTLFDLGYAVDQRRHDKKLRSVPIAVAVTGDCRNIISLRTLEEEILELTSPEKLAFRAPSIDTTEMSQWSDCGAPIRQVCFARPIEEKPIFLAARLPTATVIFRPLYHWDPVPMRFPDSALMGFSIPLQNSRLDANPIVKVSLSQTGGFPHADVTFNPWYQKQFAIVDTRGNWSVWEITGRQRLKLATWSAALVKAGSMPSPDPTRKRGSTRLDGWASIEWVHSVGSVVVANRRSVVIYAFTDDQVPPRTVELGITRQSEWVLGLQRNPRNPSQFFVLTTTRILWFDIGGLPGEDDTSQSLHPRASWRHFRDPEDTTLRLSDIVVYQDLYLVLYSQLTQLVQAFPCPFIADEQTESISVPDPLILDAPLLMDVPPNRHDSPMRFSSLVFREIAHSVTPLGRSFYNPDLTLIKLFWMDGDLAVHESAFKGPRGDPEEPDPFRESSILRLRKRYTPTAYVRPDDNFVVDDWDESVTQQAVAPRYNISTASDTGSDLQWTLDFSTIYDIATGKSEIPRIKQKKRQRPKPRTLDGLIASLQSEMETGPMKQSPSQTLAEMSGKRLLAEGLDESADDVKRLVSALMPESPDPGAQCRYMLLSIPISNDRYGIPAKLSEEADKNLFNVYDRIVDDWMSTLPRIIPVHTRLMKEKLIRGVAADLILSRLLRISTSLDGINLPQLADAEEDQVNEQAVAQNQHLHSSYFSLLSSSQIPASQSSMTNSRLFGSRRDPMPAQQSKYAAVPVLSGLSAFTTFKSQRPTPRNVTNLLSHWSVGSNPQEYTWERIEDEETRRSSRPNTPRSRRKKRSQTRDQSLPPTPSVPMVRTWGSQPVAPRINSSQPTDGMPMTQMERGIFGAREFKKPKKKKRAAGF
ncbi:uncharacterized protein N7515_005260 [Penicillium bovifimosum]|uniref:RNA polymerase I-specific transcription initiation factor RRN6-like protein n=1 Tax=Penicillium bovifimosum TaxID=126998 RepID=A0A9W9GTP1_9EURO|nr:uncharacterized protein N7515_005260 [Penicillium bovifimosum]KAJ5129221.1 hypothetical protein N7515_005260 [Penicillium bovifimosum]